MKKIISTCCMVFGFVLFAWQITFANQTVEKELTDKVPKGSKLRFVF